MEPLPFDPAISFSSEEHRLRELFELVCDIGSGPITIVCGAGVSQDSGLPSWKSLVEGFAEDVPDQFKRFVQQDSTDLQRKVALIRAIMPQHLDPVDTLRRALYRGFVGRASGLASSIAALAKGDPDRFRLATTNFDDLLEVALRDLGSTSSPRGIERASFEAWETSKNDVLHLHGCIPNTPASGPVLEPIILSDSDFYTYGSEVRRRVVSILKKSHVVYVGMSMTDPNIVGVLLDNELMNRHKKVLARRRRFVIISPDHLPSELQSGPDERRSELNRKRLQFLVYGRRRTRAISNRMSVEPIFLNAYSQASQLFAEFEFALTDAKSYLDSDSQVRYGRRLTRYLNYCWNWAGLASPDSFSKCQHSITMDLRNRLEQLEDSLARLVRTSQDTDIRIERNRLLRQLKTENFGLRLWIRNPIGEDGVSEYTISRIGSSSNSPHDQWSLPKAAILANSPFPAATCIFTGLYRKDSVEFGSDHWQSMFSTPVAVGLCGVDTTIGSISLVSDQPLGPESSVDSMQRRSVIGSFNTEESRTLSQWLRALAVEVLPSWEDSSSVDTLESSCINF